MFTHAIFFARKYKKNFDLFFGEVEERIELNLFFIRDNISINSLYTIRSLVKYSNNQITI